MLNFEQPGDPRRSARFPSRYACGTIVQVAGGWRNAGLRVASRSVSEIRSAQADGLFRTRQDTAAFLPASKLPGRAGPGDPVQHEALCVPVQVLRSSLQVLQGLDRAGIRP